MNTNIGNTRNAFQFTPARGGRPLPTYNPTRVHGFNSRPRVAGDIVNNKPTGDKQTFQFTPARGGRPHNLSTMLSQEVSIHARAWRATSKRESRIYYLQLFQFTPARGGRRLATTLPYMRSIVSIHARAWRATEPTIIIMIRGRFNSRPRVAGDCKLVVCAAIIKFQFTPARGGRLKRIAPSNMLCSCFNSRPRVAGDRRCSRCSGACWSFNSRPRVAGDSRSRRAVPTWSCFNSRPRVAGDGRVGPVTAPSMFQFTPARGGRLAYIRLDLPSS